MLLLARQLGSILHNNEGIATVVVDGIQCVKKCTLAGGGEVYFPRGKYVLSTVFLKSNVQIVFEDGVEIWGSLNFSDYCPDEKVEYPLYQDASHSFFIVLCLSV